MFSETILGLKTRKQRYKAWDSAEVISSIPAHQELELTHLLPARERKATHLNRDIGSAEFAKLPV